MDRNTLITVREFDYLTPSSQTRNRNNGKVAHGLGRKDFDALRSLVIDDAENHGDEVGSLMRLCSPPGVGEAVQVTGNVGVIEFADGKQLEILPKIDTRQSNETREQGNERIRATFVKMLSALGPEQANRTFDMANLGHDDLPLMEVFIEMFLSDTTELVRKGLRSGYVKTHAYQQTIRGRIDFSRQALANPAHAELTHIGYSEFSLDRAENRLLKTCLEYLCRASKNSENKQKIKRLLPAFDSVSTSVNLAEDFSKCTINRGTAQYEQLLAWCAVFLQGESFTTFHGDAIAQALLFSMDKVFEDFVFQQLEKAGRRNSGIRHVRAQVDSRYLFEGRKVRLRPDILVDLVDGTRVILDTKWKITDGKHANPSDMHQMYAYGKKYSLDSAGNTNQRVILLYPWHTGDGIKPGDFCKSGHYKSNDNVEVDTFFVDIDNAAKSATDLLDDICKCSQAVPYFLRGHPPAHTGNTQTNPS